jgi:hypothetical protein
MQLSCRPTNDPMSPVRSEPGDSVTRVTRAALNISVSLGGWLSASAGRPGERRLTNQTLRIGQVAFLETLYRKCLCIDGVVSALRVVEGKTVGEIEPSEADRTADIPFQKI